METFLSRKLCNNSVINGQKKYISSKEETILISLDWVFCGYWNKISKQQISGPDSFSPLQTARKFPTQILPALRCHPVSHEDSFRYPPSYHLQHGTTGYSHNSEAPEGREAPVSYLQPCSQCLAHSLLSSIKGQILNIIGFMDSMVSLYPGSCHYRAKAPRNKMKMKEACCAPKLYLQKQGTSQPRFAIFLQSV